MWGNSLLRLDTQTCTCSSRMSPYAAAMPFGEPQVGVLLACRQMLLHWILKLAMALTFTLVLPSAHIPPGTAVTQSEPFACPSTCFFRLIRFGVLGFQQSFKSGQAIFEPLLTFWAPSGSAQLGVTSSAGCG